MHESRRCENYGLVFRRSYAPGEFIEGNRDSRIWIVGLNPAFDTRLDDESSVSDLQQYFDSPAEIHRYF